jgi:hypothetical protein
MPVRHHGAASTVDFLGLLQNLFDASSETQFHWNQWATVNGKTMAVFNYGFQLNGKTHAGLIFADENTGAISRITFRGTDAPAHLFCSPQSR